MAGLLARCAQGDEKALEELYRAAAPRLFGICMTLVKREDLAEDILQECFVKIWNHAGSYDPKKGAGMTWMISIVRNRGLDLLRSSRAQMEQASQEFHDEEFQDAGVGPLEAADIEASTAAVVKCLNQLEDKQRRCIVMAYYHGYTHEELARAVDAPLGTVKAWIRRGLERVRQCLE